MRWDERAHARRGTKRRESAAIGVEGRERLSRTIAVYSPSFYASRGAKATSPRRPDRRAPPFESVGRAFLAKPSLATTKRRCARSWIRNSVDVKVVWRKGWVLDWSLVAQR